MAEALGLDTLDPLGGRSRRRCEDPLAARPATGAPIWSSSAAASRGAAPGAAPAASTGHRDRPGVLPGRRGRGPPRRGVPPQRADRALRADRPGAARARPHLGPGPALARRPSTCSADDGDAVRRAPGLRHRAVRRRRRRCSPISPPAAGTSSRRCSPAPGRRGSCTGRVPAVPAGARRRPGRTTRPVAYRCRVMGVSQRLKSRFRRFLQRPGTTVDLAPLEKLLPAIEAREEELRGARRRRADRGGRRGRRTTSRSARSAGRPPAARLDQRPYDVQLLGAMALLAGKVAEMATGEGKTLTAADRRVRARPARQRPGARAHRQRLPGPPRRRMDGAGLHPARADRRLGQRGVHPRASAARRTPATSRTSRSARPASTTCATSSSPTSPTGSAGAGHRDRRRGRLDPDRRGPGADGAGRHASPASRTRCTPPPRWCAACARASTTRSPTTAAASRSPPPGLAAVEAQARRHRPVRRGERRAALRGQRGAARARPAAPRRRLHRPRRHGRADRRDARPGRPAPPLAGRAAGRGRGQGGPGRHRRGRGARHHHRAGVHRALPDGLRHDRHRGARRRPAAGVLQARGRGDPAEHPVHPRGRAGPDLRHPGGEGRGADRRDRSAAHATGRPVLVGTLDVKESERLAAGAERGRGAVRGAQRQERRRGSGDHRRGRRVRRGDRLHPDGRPGRRHPPRRQRRDATGSGSPSSAAST